MSVAELLAAPQVRSIHTWPEQIGICRPWPDWVPDEVRLAAGRLGISQPWQHQVEAAEAAYGGRHVALATPTGSGKTLAYLLPVLAAAAARSGPMPAAARSAPLVAPEPRSAGSWDAMVQSVRPPTALYLAPTKALAHDQLRQCAGWELPGWRLATVDGDSEPSERDWARDHATYVLTNPDMLHCSILPGHPRWRRFLSCLRYVVVDEAHRYSGVFGAHVAAVLRRLRRLCAAYGASPVFVAASATGGNAAATAAALIGVPESAVTLVEADVSPRGPRTVVLWQPAATPEDDAAQVLARLVAAGRQTVAFAGSRRAAEVIAREAGAQVSRPPQVATKERAVAGTRPRIEAYRGGYLASDRRRLERDLQAGTLHGVAATNALELGVDIAGLDAVVIAGFPGTRAAFWQQAGRAGRAGAEALVVLMARPHPLDAYLLDHPEWLNAPVEATVLHPANPYVLGPQLAAAAQELPLTLADIGFFGPSLPTMVRRLEAQQVLRQRPQGWYWTRAERAVDAIDLRAAGQPVEIVEARTGRVLGDVGLAAADAAVHSGAVYLHQGETYVVEDLDHGTGEALVVRSDPGYTTQARGTSTVRIIGQEIVRPLGRGRIARGEVEVSSQVTGYLRRDLVTGRVWDETPLELPVRTLRTAGCWWTLDPDQIDADWTPSSVGAGLHAAEHAGTMLLGAYAPCDRWDVGGSSTTNCPDTGGLTVFIHDLQPGGAGFAARAYAVADQWLAAALDRLERCACPAGCPACVVSPTCGRARPGLDKLVARGLLDLLVGRGAPRKEPS